MSEENESALVVTSGGLDSTTLLYMVVKENPEAKVTAISFDYGQRHKKELEYAKLSCDALDVSHRVVDITSITSFLAPGGSSLVSETAVPEGHYAEENMKATVVPNRNMIMASIAAGHAIAIGAQSLFMGVHAGDHFIYPDCRPEFFGALNSAIVFGNDGFGPIDPVGEPNELGMLQMQMFVRTPFIYWSKADIAYEALKIGMPLENTWSCYKGGEIHCGKCGTCVERLEAIHMANMRRAEEDHPEIQDNTKYEDRDFWMEALKRETV